MDKVILFDLDGTLVNSAKGIIASFQAALKAGGHPIPEADTLNWIVGPPLRRNFEALLSDPEQVSAGVAEYRKLYGAGGMFEASVYDGILPLLTTLKAQGYKLFVCTAKPEIYARQIVEHFGLMPYFLEVYGPDINGRFEDKADLIAHILEVEGLQADDVIMIGDRDHDTKSAVRNGLKSIGVLWGFGGENELTQGGASALCAAPADIAPLVKELIGKS